MKKRTSAIGDILKKVVKNLGGKKRLTEEEFFKIWEEAAGKKAASHTRPVSFRKAGLIVNVDDSGWLYELTINKKEILKKFASGINGKPLKDIRFRIGQIKGK